MSFNIGFDLCNETDEDTSRFIVKLAQINRELGNHSLLLSSTSINLTQELRQILNTFELIQYADGPRFDLICIEKRIKMIYRQSPKQSTIFTLVTPLFIIGDRPEDINGIGLNEWKNLTQDPNTLSSIFKEKVLDRMISAVPTVGHEADSGFSIVSIGSYPQKEISTVKYSSLQTLINQSLNIIETEKLQTIKLVCNWTTSEQLLKDWSHMLNETWNARYQWIKSGEPDYWIIINAPPLGENFIPSKSIVYRMEPYIDNIPSYNNWLGSYLKTDFLFFLDHAHFRNNTEWWLQSNLTTPIRKNKVISAIISSRYDMQGHKLRIDFIKYIQEHSNFAIDLYGFENKHQLKDWKGSLPSRQKDGGLIPYKYHLAVENSDIVNYATEKFWDGLLSECLVFYWGCSNLEEHVDKRAFIRLDLNDKPASLERIKTAITNNEYEQRIQIIKHEKNRIMGLYHCFSRTPSLIESTQMHFVQIIRSKEQLQGIPGVKLEHILSEQRIDLSAISGLLSNYMLSTISIDELTRMYEHKKLWEQTIRSNRSHCIIDGSAGSNFLDRITEIMAYSMMAKLECDIIFLFSIIRINKRLNDESTADTSLTPIIEPFISHLMKNSEIQADGQRISIPTQSSSGYIIHPRGAAKLMKFINNHGFIMPLDSLLMLCNSFIPDLHTFIFDKNMVSPTHRNKSPVIRILRRNSNGNWENKIYPFNQVEIRPASEMMLIMENEPQK